jgi:two-component system, cell cycle response regulator DivK
MRERPLLLIVDDAEDSRDLYAYFLSGEGFDVALAADGKAAIDEAIRLAPDLIVLDLSLPVVDGRAAGKRIKAEERTRRIPIIAVSGFSRSDLQDDDFCDAFLTKPCAPEDLLRTVRELLAAAETRGRL